MRRDANYKMQKAVADRVGKPVSVTSYENKVNLNSAYLHNDSGICLMVRGL